VAVLNPQSTTVLDLCTRALKDAGALGIGQSANADEITDAWASLQWMLQQWQNQRWMVYHLVTQVVTSTGQTTPYSVGPGAQFASVSGSANASALASQAITTKRPDRIESAFFRQLTNTSAGPVDFPLKLLSSMENYNQICLKQLSTFSLSAFYDPAWGTSQLGQLYVYPWPLANLYAVGITVRETLPASFASLATVVNLPFEYFQAIVSNLALVLRPKYGLGTWPGDLVPLQAKNGLRVIQAGNTAIAELGMPVELARRGIYNIYSDQSS
jgi:hypothetical protein